MHTLPRLHAVLPLLLLCAFPSGTLAKPARLSLPLVALDLPHTVMVEAGLKPLITRMLEGSPTFREQCRRLDISENLVVVLRADPLIPKDISRARSTINRYSSGVVIVNVTVAPGSDQPQWIAHEFEHALEVREGQNLPQLARRGRTAGESADRMFETLRATKVGRAVQSEIRASERPDKHSK
jgi:hypothetical protein